MRRWLTWIAIGVGGCVPSDDPPDSARCAQEGAVLTCAHQTTEVLARAVHWQVPLGDLPPGGWPAVILFHASFVPASLCWTGTAGDVLGSYEQTATIAHLLDAGFAVITPQAGAAGHWDTNVPTYALAWELAPDHTFVLALLAAIEDGAFGAFDAGRLYATGISSGGYMTSRMAVSYPGRFRALAVCSGSYATCAGPLCAVPDLPDDHPPTLFVHGALDVVVPVYTMQRYHDALVAQGTATWPLIAPASGHRWLPQAVDGVPAWFAAHP